MFLHINSSMSRFLLFAKAKANAKANLLPKQILEIENETRLSI